MLCVALCAFGTAARAQTSDLPPLPTQLPVPSLLPQQRLVLLHRGGEGVAKKVRGEVDDALSRAVTSQVTNATLYVSPVPFEEVELAAGCGAQDVDCMQRIASSLGADWLLVRELARDATGQTFLTLVAHDGPQAYVTRRAVAEVGSGKQAPARVVPMLIERLYPSQHAGDRPIRDEPRRVSTAAVIGWSGAALGGGLLAAGVTMGALSRRDHEAYRNSEILTPEDVDHARGLLGRSQQRARIANGLLIGGAGASIAGAVGLIWNLVRPKPNPEEKRSFRFAVAPYRGGMKFSMNCAWKGGF